MQSQRQFKPFVISNHALEDPVELRGILERQGYLFLKRVAPVEPVLRARCDVLELCRDAGWIERSGDPLEAKWSGAGPFTEGDPAYMEVYRRVLHLDSFNALPECAELVALMQKVVAGPVLTHRRKIGRITFPNNTAQATGAHQDFFYIRGTEQTYTMWMPLGDCPMQLGSLAVLAGSHTLGFIEHVTVPGKKYAGFGLPDDQLPAMASDWHASDFGLGDVLIFHAHTIHEALPNLTRDTLRLSVDNRYQLAGMPIEPSSMGTHYNL